MCASGVLRTLDCLMDPASAWPFSIPQIYATPATAISNLSASRWMKGHCPLTSLCKAGGDPWSLQPVCCPRCWDVCIPSRISTATCPPFMSDVDQAEPSPVEIVDVRMESATQHRPLWTRCLIRQIRCSWSARALSVEGMWTTFQRKYLLDLVAEKIFPCR